MKRFFSMMVALGISSSVVAQGVDIPRCTWESVAQKHAVNPYLLFAIATTESRLRPGVVSKKNKDGTYDIGLMQINSSWLPKLGRYGVSEASLFDSCVNLDVGAWILAGNMKRLGNTWKAVGAYNAKSEAKQLSYAKQVLRNVPREAIYAGNGQ